MENATSLKTLFLTFAGLILLLGFAMGVPYLRLGELNTWASFSIAALKALLISFGFMEIAKGSRLYPMAFAAGWLWLALLIFMSAMDVFHRR